MMNLSEATNNNNNNINYNYGKHFVLFDGCWMSVQQKKFNEIWKSILQCFIYRSCHTVFISHKISSAAVSWMFNLIFTCCIFLCIFLVKTRDNDSFLSLLWISAIVKNWNENRDKYQCNQRLSDSSLKQANKINES